MSLPQLPDVRDGLAAWAVNFLNVTRRLLLQLGHGVPDPLGRAVTFRDLVEMGLAAPEAAQKRAREGR
jgi:hypothetical protein